MKKIGFTLVELLAVIAILAILIIIALPNILKLFNEAQMKIFLQEAKNINKAAEDSYLVQKMGITSPLETTYTYVDGEETVTGNIKVSITGQKPRNGELLITPNGETALAFHNGKYCAMKILGSDEITISKVTPDQCILDFVTSEECFVIDPDEVEYISQTYGVVEPFNYDYDYDSNEAVIYQYRYNNPNCSRNVVIPEIIDGKTVVAIESGAFASGSIGYYIEQDIDLASLYIPSTVRFIGNRAFQNNSLKKVTIPNGVTYIGTSAFWNNQLTSLSLGNNVTTIGESSFHSNQLKSVTIPNSVITIGTSAFYDNQLTSLSLGNHIETIEWNAFGNNQLSSVTIPNSVETIGERAFAYNQLSSVTLGNNLVYIGYGAFETNILTNVVIPDSVTSIEDYAFYTNNITSVTLGNSVQYIGTGSFRENQLTTVTIPSSVTSIGNYAFYNGFTNNLLTSVFIRGKSSSAGFTSYGSNIWGWAPGYSNSNITWNAP
jgi:prepilin-type N-terminal cleavage/methylation domain-containing protein